jgi:transcriptional regulator
MYVPKHSKETDVIALPEIIRAAGLAHLVTATVEGPIATPLPLLLDAGEGEFGALYGHFARANPQWQRPIRGEALAMFSGPDFYATPSWYAAKRDTGRVVPTWNYIAVHAYGPVEFLADPDRLLQVVTRLTDRQERARANPWSVSDAPESFVRAQLKGIVGLRLPIRRLEGKRKMSQNRSAADRAGVRRGIEQDPRTGGYAGLVP